MPTLSGHTTAIRASRVTGTSVYNNEGSSIGTIEDIILDKTSNKIMFAVVGFGGVLGLGEKFHPIPWALLNYDKDKGGYLVPMSKETLNTAPVFEISDLTKHDGDIRDKSYSFYKVPQDW